MKSEFMDDFMNQAKSADTPCENSATADQWETASELFPPHPFPWNAFPSLIKTSLQQAARSCATSDVSMPGAAMTIMSSVLGRTVSVSPKVSWYEPLIFWMADIRSSGEGKTPSVSQLLNPVYEAQRETDERYRAELELWEATPKKNRGALPRRPAAQFATDLTLEGLRMDVQQGHGGLVCYLDEISSMITAQNAYKQKGNDREAWLALWEGKPARITRAGGAITIYGARISVFGGIQPAVFKEVFGGGRRIYCTDGTIFRFLLTYEKDSFFTLTNESWTVDNRRIWESTLKNAIAWSEEIISVAGWEPHVLKLTDDAQRLLFEYRNQIFKNKDQLPALLKGFIPKAVSYILRIAGVLHCMSHFAEGGSPGQYLFEEDIKRAISVVEFYLAHAVITLRLINDDFSPDTVNGTTASLRRTIASLRDDLDSERLAVGYIFNKFNEQCNPALKIKSERAMGTLLREHGLTILPGKHDANGRRGVCCLIWDEKTEQFVQTLQTSTDQCLHGENLASTGSSDIADFADFAGEEFDIEGNILC